MVGERDATFKVVRGHEYRPTGIIPIRDERFQKTERLLIEAAFRFVHNQHTWRVQQGAGYAEAAAHAV